MSELAKIYGKQSSKSRYNIQPDPADDPSTDVLPSMILLLQALVGTTWWGMSWFIYVKTSIGDADIIPVFWFWTQLFSTTAGWMAVSYFSTFLVGLVVSFGEVVAWMIFAIGYPGFAGLYF